MNDLIDQNNQSAPQQNALVDPFARVRASGGLNVGAVSIEQERAIAEAQGQLVLAKRFPRSMAGATAEMMDACKSPDFAASAFYAVPNRGSGPSIRFAEEAARCYGNFQYGHRELSRSEGKSEIEVYAWDMERNNRSTRQITVLHVLDTRSNGAKKLTDQSDIDNKIANVASKQIRGRILALMPKGLVAAAIAECKKTIAGGNDKPIGQRVNDMTSAFAKFGVTVAHLESNLGHKLDTTTIDELADLIGIFNAIRDGAKASEYFTVDNKADDAAGGSAIAAAAKQATANKQAAAPAAATPAADAPPPVSPAPKPARTAAKAPVAAPPPADPSPAQDASVDPRGDEPPGDEVF